MLEQDGEKISLVTLSKDHDTPAELICEKVTEQNLVLPIFEFTLRRSSKPL